MTLVRDTYAALSVMQGRERQVVLATITNAIASDSRQQAERFADKLDAKEAVLALKTVNYIWPRIEESYELILNA